MKKAVSGCFLMMLCLLFAGTLCTGLFRDMRDVYIGYGGGIKGLILTAIDRDDLDDRLNEDVFLHDNWIDLFGGALRVSGVCSLREDDGKHIVRLKDDRLTFVRELLTPTAKQLEWMRALRQAAQDAGVSYLYVTIPQKTCPDGTEYCDRGAANQSEKTDRAYADAFAAAGYPVLDMHERMHAEGKGHTQLYFRTDHHWLGDTALWAAGVLAKELGLPTDELDPQRFDAETYPHAFLGSEGKHFGRLYCGMDDFSIPIPRFATDLTQSNDMEPSVRTGSFSEAFLYRENLEYDPFDSSMYVAFLGGDRGWVHICNNLLPQGRRVLLIKDSYSNSMAPYLALTCGQLDLIDMRHYTGSAVQCVQEGGYDAVVVATYCLDAQGPE